MLDLRPDKHGAPLVISERRQRLIQLQHHDAYLVEVKKIHGGFSGSMVLQTTGFSKTKQRLEPEVAKLDSAEALDEEVHRLTSVSEALGSYANSIAREPLYMNKSGGVIRKYRKEEHGEDVEGAVMLELAGACWVLPEQAVRRLI